MDDRQLIEDLLSALEYHTEQTRPIEFSRVAIEAAREYLRKPAHQQEPVAHVYLFDPNGRPRVAWDNAKDIKIGDKLYTSPPAQQQEPVAWMDGYRNIYSLEEKAAGCEDAVIPLVPATLQHWSDCAVHNEPAYPTGKCDCGGFCCGEEFNKQPAQQQEPVAWATQMGEYAHLKWGAKRPEYPMVYEVPLYTSPPASKPLTDEQIWDEVKAADLDWQTGWSLDEDAANRYIIFARAIEAAHGIKENT